MTTATCSVPECDRAVNARGFCQKHYFRWRAHGDPLITLIAPPGSGHLCNGYYMHTVDGKRKLDHITIAERAVGHPLPAGAEVHHVDANRGNNSNKNLVVCPDGAYHQLLHVRTAALAACGNPAWRKCAYCKQYDDVSRLYKHPRSPTYNHRECYNVAQRARRAAA